jgi:hypothetical protein
MGRLIPFSIGWWFNLLFFVVSQGGPKTLLHSFEQIWKHGGTTLDSTESNAAVKYHSCV